jgi:hypothetical protein
MAQPVLRAVSPDVFDLAEIRLDKRQRTATFPAVVNMTNGPLEYLLVTSYGKKHESLLRTEVLPYNLHLAMLLLGVGSRTNTVSTPPPAQIKNPSAEAIPGSKIAIEVSWEAEGRTVRRSAEDLLYNQQAKATLSQGAWVYNGSEIWDGSFLAERDGSIVSLVTDLTALMNNSGLGHDDDHIWTANPGGLPAPKTPVVVTLRLAAATAAN